MSKELRVVLAGGVSGGHIYPLIAVSEAMRRAATEADVILTLRYMGPDGSFEENAMRDASIPTTHIQSGKWRRYFSPLNFLDIFRVLAGFFQCLAYLWYYLPDVVFAKGGAASIPIVLVAWIYRIPVVIHDSDAIVGRANRFLAYFATEILSGFPNLRGLAPDTKFTFVGNPVREVITSGTVESAVTRFGLTNAERMLLVLGGSQGAQSLNQLVLEALPRLVAAGYSVLHQVGERNLEYVQSASAYLDETTRKSYHPHAFLNSTELSDAYAVASIILCRSGASSLSEALILGKPTITVPIPTSANDHQRANAYTLADSGAVLVIEESNLGPNLLLQTLTGITNDANYRSAAHTAMVAVATPDADTTIANILLSYAG
jgi:UDP-N-acetylglucosamine--N-acetylmuramyl-(pentapeptide) pyrophosphoryl-undecaprenol N-acetylglucosamine transferase